MAESYYRAAVRFHARMLRVIRCGARTRAGGECRNHIVPGSWRCKLHGGLSTGPRTPEGRAAIAESNRRRAKRAGGNDRDTLVR